MRLYTILLTNIFAVCYRYYDWGDKNRKNWKSIFSLFGSKVHRIFCFCPLLTSFCSPPHFATWPILARCWCECRIFAKTTLRNESCNSNNQCIFSCAKVPVTIGFPLTQILAYVWASGEFCDCLNIGTVPITQFFCNAVFSRNQNAHEYK